MYRYIYISENLEHALRECVYIYIHIYIFPYIIYCIAHMYKDVVYNNIRDPIESGAL